MFGYRARIGYISPSVIELNGYDFYRIVPDGVSLIAVACMVGGWKEEAYKEALKQVEGCAKELARRKCDFVIHLRRAVGAEPRQRIRNSTRRQITDAHRRALHHEHRCSYGCFQGSQFVAACRGQSLSAGSERKIN